MNRQQIPKAVLFLGVTSLLTDVASEAAYPLIPLFLTQTLGASLFFVGLFEGVAESVASITKYFSGYYSDKLKVREPFVIAGYTLANTIRPLIGLASTPVQVLGLRFTDRIGKGLRSAPRDAWLAGLATPESRGWIFGFHRAMDHAGAVIGPLLATAVLYFMPGQYRTLFLLTIIPGWIAVFFVFAAKKAQPAGEFAETSKKVDTEQLKKIPGTLKTYFLILALFTLGNSSDAFLLLKMRSAGVPDFWIPMLWAGLHVVKMSSSFMGGQLSDRIGRRPAIIAGWLLYAAVYLVFGLAADLRVILPVFLIYGVFYGLTEGPEKALVADLALPEQHGTAYGLYNLVIGIGALPSSLLFGWIWHRFGAFPAFGTGALLALASSVSLMFLPAARRGTAGGGAS